MLTITSIAMDIGGEAMSVTLSLNRILLGRETPNDRSDLKELAVDIRRFTLGINENNAQRYLTHTIEGLLCLVRTMKDWKMPPHADTIRDKLRMIADMMEIVAFADTPSPDVELLRAFFEKVQKVSEAVTASGGPPTNPVVEVFTELGKVCAPCKKGGTT
jgi:hypothetical protein